MIALVNYGLGNIQAFSNIFRVLNIPFVVAEHIDDLAGATKIVLPGVGGLRLGYDAFGGIGVAVVLGRSCDGEEMSSAWHMRWDADYGAAKR
jgi:imidazoleglycerol phosphate synthase glutamine amidotransferase subunit HisH